MIKNSGTWVGKILFREYFAGSRSSGVYPALVTIDNKVFRIRIKDANQYDAIEFLRAREGSLVSISGVLDNLRGHLRLSCTKQDINFRDDFNNGLGE